MVRRRYYSRLTVMPLVLLWATCPVHGALSLKQNQRREQDDETTTISIKLPQQTVKITKPNKEEKYSIRLPSRVLQLSEKAKKLNDGQDSSFIKLLEREEQVQAARARKPNPSASGRSRIESSPILHGSLALLVMTSFVFTTHGFKALKELAMSSLSALALVWVPTFIVHGGWAELFGVATLLTQPNVRRFMVKEFFPKALSTLKKLFLTEIWRRVWALVLAPLPKPLLVPSEVDIMRIRWLPDWMKEGFLFFRDKVDNFALSTFKSSVQKSVHGTMGIFYDSFSSSVLEVSMLYEESVDAEEMMDGTEDSTTQDSGDISDAESDDDGPQLVCDGDTCRFE
mmetsp:Transcript_48706/g.137031  ORF Transcript_48706/g.137031 Transcript_48706/m.137031 type:complete len:341 (-) Transcript_48706:29-1051(-)